jgi:hypothetical protein
MEIGQGLGFIYGYAYIRDKDNNKRNISHVEIRINIVGDTS